MPSLNLAIIAGHLGADPEVRYLSNGDAVCNFQVATTEHWTDKNTGDKKESTEWHKVTFFRKNAENCGKFLKKGSAVYVKGKIKTRKWQDKEGNDRYTTEINGDEFQVLSGGRKKDEVPDDTPVRGVMPENDGKSGFEDMESDLPF